MTSSGVSPQIGEKKQNDLIEKCARLSHFSLLWVAEECVQNRLCVCVCVCSTVFKMKVESQPLLSLALVKVHQEREQTVLCMVLLLLQCRRVGEDLPPWCQVPVTRLSRLNVSDFFCVEIFWGTLCLKWTEWQSEERGQTHPSPVG